MKDTEVIKKPVAMEEPAGPAEPEILKAPEEPAETEKSAENTEPEVQENLEATEEKGEFEVFKEIDWDSLTFSNNYVFLEVMKDKKRCQYLIEKVLHIPIKRILHIVAERYTSSPRISSKNIRLDVYLETLDGTVIDLEMQTTGKGSTIYRNKENKVVQRELPLRTRYYQSLVSMDMLRRGMDYPELRKSYVVFICTFDPYGKGLPVYHFTYRCHEDDGLQMGDLTENIFLNATAADRTEDRELAAFLRYVDNGLAGNRFTQELDEETTRVKNDKEWRERTVTWEMDMRILEKAAEERGRKEGRREGEAKGRKETVDDVANLLRSDFNMPEAVISAIKEKLATPKDAVKA